MYLRSTIIKGEKNNNGDRHLKSTWRHGLLLYGSIFGKRDLLAIDHIMLALFWSYVPNMK